MYVVVFLGGNVGCLGAPTNVSTRMHHVNIQIETTCCSALRADRGGFSRRHVAMKPFLERDEVWSFRCLTLTDLLGAVALKGADY
jgi:hypothetical protein